VTPAADHLQRRGVVSADHLGRQLQDALQHHRNQNQGRAAHSLDGSQTLLGVESFDQHHRREYRSAHLQRGEAPGVKQRRGKEHHFVTAQRHP